MATQNPLEMEGTYPLPEAQLDRFLLKALVPFPSAEELVAVVDRTTPAAPAPRSSPVIDAAGLAAMIKLTRQVPVAEHLTRHAVDLVVATHPERPEAPGCGEALRAVRGVARGAQALVLAAKAAALLDGRRPTSPPTTSGPWPPPPSATAWCCGYEASASGVTADDLVASGPRSRPRPPGGAPRRPVPQVTAAATPAAARAAGAGPARHRRRLAGRFAGEHRSTRRGASLDFADYREYQRGDDPRRIDAGVWARL